MRKAAHHRNGQGDGAICPCIRDLAHMVVAGKGLKAGRLAADLAALLSERDLLERGGDADLVSRIDALRGGRALANRGAKETGARSGAADPRDRRHWR